MVNVLNCGKTSEINNRKEKSRKGMQKTQIVRAGTVTCAKGAVGNRCKNVIKQTKLYIKQRKMYIDSGKMLSYDSCAERQMPSHCIAIFIIR